MIRRLMLVTGLVLVGGCDSAPTAPVDSVPLSSLVVTPASDTLQVGEFADFTATAVDTGGVPVTDPVLDWRSSNPQVITVSQTGRATAVGEGLAFVIVSSGGRSDSATVLVLPALAGWFTQTSGTSADLHDVTFAPDGVSGWAVGAGGRIIATRNAGSSWTTQISTTASVLRAVWFTSLTEGWVVGDGGTILHTVNGGTTWSRVLPTNASENLFDVTFTTADTGFAVGAAGVVLRTTDHGVSWTRQVRTVQTLRAVSFATTRDGWAVGDGGVVLGTHDRGASWFIVQPSVTAQGLRGLHRRSLEVAHAVGVQGVTPRTVVTPDSVAWELRNAGAANQLEDVFFPTDAVGFAVGVNGTGVVLRTEDGGLGWTPQPVGSQFPLNGVFFVDVNRGWAVGDNGRVIHTATGGLP